MNKHLFSFLLCLLPFTLFAQQFGGNPHNILWMNINTPSTRVIFPKHADSIASRVASVTEKLTLADINPLGSKLKKINLVLQNQTTVSNAYVGLGPFRSEFYLTPQQNSFELGSLPWVDQLTTHEFRHVQQYNNFNVGVSKVFSFLFGEEGQAIANNAAIPNWFFEGDAVYNETSVSYQGRGRLPYFFNDFRSLWKENRKCSWMKLRNGSYKDFVPDHYILGYLLVAYGYEKYGTEFWKNVTHDAASFRGLTYPFQKAIKKYSGKNYVEFRNDAFNYFKNNLADKKTAPVKRSFFSDEEYPAIINEKNLLFVKSSYKEVPAFFIKENGKERKLRDKDVSLDAYFSYKNGKIVYASYAPDKRWGNTNYSELQLLDVNSGKQNTITRHTKYFSPDINESGTRVVAVDVSPNGFATLHILDNTGKLLKQLPNPNQLFYTSPKFINDSIVVAAVRNKTGKMSLALINFESGSTAYLTDFGFNVIGFPNVQNDTIYFSSSFKTEDQLFAYSLPQKKLFLLNIQQQKTGTGFYQPSVINNQIVWTTFTAEGFKISKSDLSSITFEEVSSAAQSNETSDFFVSSLNKNRSVLSSISDNIFPVSKYRKSFNLFNFHSIEPYISDPQYTLTLVGENILNTLQSQISVTYDRAEKSKTAGGGIVYGGLYPFISAGINYSIDKPSAVGQNIAYRNETEAYVGISQPLNFSKGRSFTFTNIGTQYVFNHSDYTGFYKGQSSGYTYLNNFFTFNHLQQKARQNIYPRFAQTLRLGYQTAISSLKGNQFTGNINLYFPSFLKNHSIVLNAGYLIKDTLRQLNFSSGFPFSRGYQAINLHQMYKWGVNYNMPLVYPDAGVANIIYLMRIRSNFFYDATIADHYYRDGTPFSGWFRSAGTEVFFDTKIWNQEAITVGIRYSYLLDKDLFGSAGNNRWELILPINIFHN
ncbi:hypothetical protein BH09BAC2_BH09BAC2_18720 [soil metagenome]